MGIERRLAMFNLESGGLEHTDVVVSDDEDVIINDGIAIPDGLLFGTKHLKFQDRVAGVYHYDAPTRRLRELVPGQICSNGKFLRTDEAGVTLIDIDSTPKTITRYRFSSGLGKLLSQELVVPPADLHAFPDGLRPSPSHESIIVAFYDAAPVDTGIAKEIRISDGAILNEWLLPDRLESPAPNW